MDTPKTTHSAPALRMRMLSRLLLPLGKTGQQWTGLAADPELQQVTATRADFDEFLALAQSNHVIVRVLQVLVPEWRQAGDEERAQWAQSAFDEEQARIVHAVGFLKRICQAFQSDGLPITVIKSLDHWPDLGSDLDLYSSAPPHAVLAAMKRHFGATLAERSWGDQLAQKWNFVLPGLPELVEFHIGRLGQTGEQNVMAGRLHSRARTVEVLGMSLPVTSASDRLMISTLQRMYRHFYFRLCDVIDSATLVTSGQVQFDDLQQVATACGIWPGVATYLTIVSDYVASYGNTPLDLPASVRQAARFGGNAVYMGREFLRVPIMPQAAKLYATQWFGLFGRGEFRSGARLSLLPWLAVAALVEQKRTGSDKGIW